MSNLWQPAGNAWESIPLDARIEDSSVSLVRFGNTSDGGVALMARPEVEVRVNGLPIIGGLCVVQHRDELLLNGHRFYFSAESLPRIVPFVLPEGTRRPTCPVCRGPMRDEEQAVQCPGCGRWFHQIEAGENRRARTCWTYAATCRFCKHPTALTGESTWRPEQEESHEADR